MSRKNIALIGMGCLLVMSPLMRLDCMGFWGKSKQEKRIAESHEAWLKDKAAVKAYAEKHQMPIRYTTEKGQVIELYKFHGEDPVYAVTFGGENATPIITTTQLLIKLQDDISPTADGIVTILNDQKGSALNAVFKCKGSSKNNALLSSWYRSSFPSKESAQKAAKALRKKHRLIRIVEEEKILTKQ